MIFILNTRTVKNVLEIFLFIGHHTDFDAISKIYPVLFVDYKNKNQIWDGHPPFSRYNSQNFFSFLNENKTSQNVVKKLKKIKCVNI